LIKMNKLFIILVIVSVLLSNVDAKKKKSKAKKNGKPQEFKANGPFFSLPLTVGSQKTKLMVGVDSYYGATLVYGTGTKCDGSDSYCIPHDTFDKTQSMTYNPHMEQHSFDFTLGSVTGTPGEDTLSVGSLKLNKGMFALTQSIPRHMNRKCPKTSGFIAMNAPETDDADKTTMQLFVEQASSPVITFFAPADQTGEHVITIGGMDTKRCKNWIDFQNQPSVDTNHKPWTIQFSGFKWGSYSKSEMLNVAMSTTADYFVAPKQHANYIYKQLNAKYSYDYSGGLVDCSKRNTAPNIEFTVPGGKKLSVSPMSYIKMFSSSVCLLNIYPDELNQWTMPYQFHQTYCVKYDYGKKTVSIADHK